MYIGKTIREIRLNKNIPANKVYKKIFSRPVISKFEKGLADTIVDRFLKIVDNLNITLEEFESFHLKGENKSTYYTNGYIDAYYNKNKLKQLIQDAEYDYEETGNEKFNHYQALMHILLADLDKSIDCKDSIAILQTYLINCNSWGYYEVTLFTNTLSFYADELIDIVYLKAISILRSVPNRERYRNEFIFLLCNILEVKILSKNIQSAKFYLSELQRQKAKQSDNMYLQAIVKYFTAIVKYIVSKEDEVTIIKVLDIFNFLELQQEREIYEEFYFKVKELYL